MQMVFMETYETCKGYRVEGTGTSSVLIVDWKIETAVRSELCKGDYSEGGTERVVHVLINGQTWGKYSAARIRKFQALREFQAQRSF